MTTYYHVAPSTYQEGDDLYSFAAYVSEYGEAPAYKWGSDTAPIGHPDVYLDSKDAQVVCMFDNLEDALDFQADYLPSGIILKIELPAWAHEEGIRISKVREGYPCIFDRIPAILAGDIIITAA